MPEAKIPAAKVLEASRGMAQKQLYVIVTTPTDGLEPVLKNLDEHLKFQVDLERRGIMFGAGPFWDDDETHWSGEGMVFTVRPWLLNEGTLTLRLNFSDMKYRLE